MSPSSHEDLAVAVAETRNEVRWLRKIVIALAIITLSPKLGGPEAPAAIGAVIHSFI